MWGYDPGNVSSPSYDHQVSPYHHKAQKNNIFITELSPVYCCLVCWFVQIERVNIRLSAINHILHHMRFQYSRGRPHFLHRPKPAGGGEGAKTEASWLLFKLQYCPHIATTGWRGHKKREASLKLRCKKWFGCNVVLWTGLCPSFSQM